MIMLTRLKAKITSLHGDQLQRVILYNDELKRLAGERDQRSFTFFRCEKTGSQNDPKYTGRMWEHPVDNERHHTRIYVIHAT